MTENLLELKSKIEREIYEIDQVLYQLTKPVPKDEYLVENEKVITGLGMADYKDSIGELRELARKRLTKLYGYLRVIDTKTKNTDVY